MRLCATEGIKGIVSFNIYGLDGFFFVLSFDLEIIMIMFLQFFEYFMPVKCKIQKYCMPDHQLSFLLCCSTCRNLF